MARQSGPVRARLAGAPGSESAPGSSRPDGDVEGRSVPKARPRAPALGVVHLFAAGRRGLGWATLNEQDRGESVFAGGFWRAGVPSRTCRAGLAERIRREGGRGKQDMDILELPARPLVGLPTARTSCRSLVLRAGKSLWPPFGGRREGSRKRRRKGMRRNKDRRRRCEPCREVAASWGRPQDDAWRYCGKLS